MKKIFKKWMQPKKILKSFFIVLPAAFLLNIYCSVPGELRISQNTSYQMALEPFCSVSEPEMGYQVSANPVKALQNTADGKVCLNTKLAHFE